MRTLKQVAINMADAFTRFGLWKGGGSGGSSGCSDMVDFDNVITTISGAKRIEYTAQENCYLYKQTVTTGSNGNEKITINGNTIGWTIYTDGYTIGGYALIPLKKDDTIIIENSSNLSWVWQPVTIYGVVKENYLHEYSTEENIVGKWIDGKPIYEKVFEIGSKSSNYTFTIENLDKIINYTGNCIISSYSRIIPFIQVQYNNFVIINDYKDGIVNLATNLSYTDCILVIQYTKTTD